MLTCHFYVHPQMERATSPLLPCREVSPIFTVMRQTVREGRSSFVLLRTGRGHVLRQTVPGTSGSKRRVPEVARATDIQ